MRKPFVLHDSLSLAVVPSLITMTYFIIKNGSIHKCDLVSFNCPLYPPLDLPIV